MNKRKEKKKIQTKRSSKHISLSMKPRKEEANNYGKKIAEKIFEMR